MESIKQSESSSISIVTPTYNRADKIYRVWESLINQTYKNFEWIIIDDGSKDDIEDVINLYKDQAEFNIVFHKFSQNKGKHIAINKGLELAKGEFFIVADSDDGFTSDAFSFFIAGWNSIPEDEKENFCGIRACCIDQKGNRVSDTLPYEPIDASMSEVFYKYKFRKESWTMVRTEWHRKFLYPRSHIGYFPEGIVWKAMSKAKKLRFYNKAIRVYFIENDENSIMRSKKHPREKISRNIVGGADVLNNDMDFFKYNPLFFMKTTILYVTYSIFNSSIKKSFNRLKPKKSKVLFIALLPLSFMAYLYKSIKN